MAEPKLSILICSIHGRELMLARLLDVLRPQLTPAVELRIDVDAGQVPIGVKRQRMLTAAAGAYRCFIDDDDLVAPHYVRSLLAAIDQGKDCVGFKVERIRDGEAWGTGIHSNRFDEFRNEWIEGVGKMWYRTPTHLNPVRAELALATGFKPISEGDDRDYARRLKPLLKSEHFVDEILYTYLYRSPHTRTHEGVHVDRWRRGV